MLGLAGIVAILGGFVGLFATTDAYFAILVIMGIGLLCFPD